MSSRKTFAVQISLNLHDIVACFLNRLRNIGNRVVHRGDVDGRFQGKSKQNVITVMSLLEAPCAKTSWRALLFRTILGITGALIVCFDNWWFKQANNSETCFGGHHCDFEQHVPCLAVYVCMNSEWSSYLRRPALLFCVGATIPWQCADSFGGRFY